MRLLPLLERRLARLPLLVRLSIGLRFPLPLSLGLGDGHPDPTERLVQGQDTLGVGLLDGERSDFRPPQRDAVPSERIGNRPDVRAGADTQIECRDARCIRDDVERVDLRAAERHLDDDALPVELVGALTSDLDRGRRRDRKLDLAAEARERSLERFCRGNVVRLERLALGIAGGRPAREIHVREVPLWQADEA